MSGGAFRVVRFKFEPNVGVTQVRNPVNPESNRSKLENATLRFFFDHGQTKRVAIESDRLLVSVIRALDRNIGAAGKIGVVSVGHHYSGICPLRFGSSTSCATLFSR